MITALFATVVSAATPSGSQEFDETTVTPGVIGFFAIFFVAVATVLLVLDMTRRVRRTRYRGEIREQLDAEEAAAADPRPSSPEIPTP